MSAPDATLAALSVAPDRSALLLDFDGSLAPIVPDPARARPLAGAVEVLDGLVAHLALVAVVSGRPAEFLSAALPVPGLRLVGQYGLEWVEDGRVARDPRVEAFAGAVAAAADEAERRWPSLVVERKGGVAVTVHWRRDPRTGARVAADVAALGRRMGLAAHGGRMACELRAPVPVDKGTAVEGLARGLRAAAFVGDDAGDLPAFGALRGLAARGELGEAVTVAVRSPEAPAEVLAGADAVVDGPDGVLAALRALLHRLPHPGFGVDIPE